MVWMPVVHLIHLVNNTDAVAYCVTAVQDTLTEVV